MWIVAHLALEEFERSSSTGRDVRKLVLGVVLGADGSRVTYEEHGTSAEFSENQGQLELTSSDDNGSTVVLGLYASIENSLGSVGKVVEFEDTSGTVPEDSLRLRDGFVEEFARFRSGIESHSSGGDTFLVGSSTNLYLRTFN
jgi:hypothetical protein